MDVVRISRANVPGRDDDDGRRMAVLAQGRLAAGVHGLLLPISAGPGVYVLNGRVGGAPVSVKVLKL